MLTGPDPPAATEASSMLSATSSPRLSRAAGLTREAARRAGRPQIRRQDHGAPGGQV